jgi:hypothetical protein
VQLKHLLAISILLAAAAFSVPLVFGETATPWCLLLALVWVALFLFVLVRHRKRGLWLLIGAPLALYWPVAIVFASVTCAHSGRFCA